MPQGEISWNVLPIKKGGKRLVIFILTVFLTVLGIYLIAGLYWAIFALIVLLSSLSSYFTPTSYKLTKDEVIVKRPLYTIRKPWSNIKRFEVDKNGIFLSPFRKPRRLENFRGIYLMTEGDREAIIKFIEERINEHDKRED